MDKAEAAGFGIALVGHAALLAALSLGFANAIQPVLNTPIEVSFVDELGLESAAPEISSAAPAPKLADIEGQLEPDNAPAEPVPAPIPQPLPKPTPPSPPQRTQPTPEKPASQKPAPPKEIKAPAKPATKPAANKPTGRLDGLLEGITDRASNSRSTSPPAATVSAAARSSLAAEIRRQLKPHWKAPTGADAELLRTELRISLARDGSVQDVDVVRTLGQTDSNRPQVKLHQEQAVRAVRLAAPFRLPADFYDAWKQINTNFDKRLAQ
ncbi:MAG: cell envelope biogenesis protein TolA [Sphingosinicella sp.]|nr:cell envelope biogenesis protein TolA [Sphingosinicella sp.]